MYITIYKWNVISFAMITTMFVLKAVFQVNLVWLYLLIFFSHLFWQGTLRITGTRFYGPDAFLSPNQQCQSIEGICKVQQKMKQVRQQACKTHTPPYSLKQRRRPQFPMPTPCSHSMELLETFIPEVKLPLPWLPTSQCSPKGEKLSR